MVVDEKFQDNPVLHNGDALPSEIKTTAFHQKKHSPRKRSTKEPVHQKRLSKNVVYKKGTLTIGEHFHKI